MSVSRRVLATALLSFGLHGVAGAEPIYYADVSAFAVDYITGVSDGDSQRVYGTRNLGPLDGSVTGASAWGSVTEIADPVDNLRTVQLHAFASSDGTGAGSNAVATFFETLTLTSDSLAAGTPVQILAELVQSWTITPNGPTAPCLGKAVAGLAWQGFGSGQLSIEDGTCDQLDTNNATGLIQGIIGQELTVYFWLQASVGPFAPSSIDASHTLSMLLTPQGDFSYVAASGNAYVEIAPPAEVPVPEPAPATMLLLGTGLAFGAHRVRQTGKFRRSPMGLLRTAVLVVAVGFFPVTAASAAPIVVGTGTLDTADDLTLLQTDANGLWEWLDLTYTKGMSVAEALAAYSSDGFHWATGSEVSELYSAFGITYASSAFSLVDLNAPIAARVNYLSYLGSTYATPGVAALGFIDDLTTPTYHTYSCISTNGCGPATFVYNTNSATWPKLDNVGVFLVRTAEPPPAEVPVPEPSSVLLLSACLVGVGMFRRAQSRDSTN